MPLRTYFKLKIKKYAVRLVLLQLLLTIVMAYLLHHRLEKNKQLTADMRLVVDNSNEWYINRISEENDRLMEKMTVRIKDEGKGEILLGLSTAPICRYESFSRLLEQRTYDQVFRCRSSSP